MHNLETVLENEMHKVLWDFEILTYLGQTTKPGNRQQKKRTYGIVDFAILTDHKVKMKKRKER